MYGLEVPAMPWAVSWNFASEEATHKASIISLGISTEEAVEWFIFGVTSVSILDDGLHLLVIGGVVRPLSGNCLWEFNPSFSAAIPMN